MKLNNNSIKLNVLLVTYNQENYIEECLDSILMQHTSFDFQIVVADDCSSDSTLDIIKKYKEKTQIEFVFLPNDKNLGIVKNYQRSFEACQAEYIAIMEGDDYWSDPYRLQKMVDFLDHHKECSMAFNRIAFYYEYKLDWGIHDWNLTDNYTYITSRQLALKNAIGNLSACVFRKKVINKLKPELFDLKVVTDWLLGMVCGQFGFVGYLKDAMSVYRVHGNGLWSGMNNKEKIDELFDCITEYNKYFEYRFNNEFISHQERINKVYRNNKRSVKDYVPPFIISLLKYLLPPALLK